VTILPSSNIITIPGQKTSHKIIHGLGVNPIVQTAGIGKGIQKYSAFNSITPSTTPGITLTEPEIRNPLLNQVN